MKTQKWRHCSSVCLLLCMLRSIRNVTFGSKLLPDDQLGTANQHLRYRKQRAINHKGTPEAPLGASVIPPSRALPAMAVRWWLNRQPVCREICNLSSLRDLKCISHIQEDTCMLVRNRRGSGHMRAGACSLSDPLGKWFIKQPWTRLIIRQSF